MDKLGHCNVNHTLKAAKFQIDIAHYLYLIRQISLTDNCDPNQS